MRILALANNSFFGSISHLCGILSVNNSLGYLDLSSNNLSGEIPDCWKYEKNLVILNLANNNLSGQIPNSIGQLINLRTLRLDNNSLSGDVTLSLKNCIALRVLGLARNKLSGNVLAWISENLQSLMILELRFNTFSGHIPFQMCQLKYLRILDLSLNNFSGTIPRCVFFGMAKETLSLIYYPYTTYSEGFILTLKSRELRYQGILHLVTLLDLSSNNLSGEIPEEVMTLVGLQILNLSRNHLVGPIPPNTGKMESLESLDLSRNHLSCTMPASMANLDFLSHLDVSHNNLSGEIPHSSQLQALSYSSFMGNPQLCGSPLSKICSRDELFEDSHCSNETGDEENQGIQKEGHDGFKIPSFYLSSGLGFITGFWGLWGSLILNRSWRHTYFRFLGNMTDKIYMTVVVGAAKLQRKFQRQQTPPK